MELKIKKSICSKKYVIGVYVPDFTEYYYRTANGWHTELQKSFIFDSSEDAQNDLKNLKLNNSHLALMKGFKYSISKVFVRRIRGKYNDRGFKIHSKITLTKPNHYEKLCAVINEI